MKGKKELGKINQSNTCFTRRKRKIRCMESIKQSIRNKTHQEWNNFKRNNQSSLKRNINVKSLSHISFKLIDFIVKMIKL